jgi:parvulin-like peptidyl-prolyl isomerase
MVLSGSIENKYYLYMNQYFIFFVVFLSFFKVSSQSLQQINSILEAENFIKSNPKAEIKTLQTNNDSIAYYIERFLGEDFKETNRVIGIKPSLMMRVRYIYLDGSKLPLSQINKRRAKIIKLFKKGKPFIELAATHTMDSGRQSLGDLDWFKEGDMHKTFEKAIRNHKKNDVFEVDIPENKWYFVVLKTHDEVSKSTLYILSLNN